MDPLAILAQGSSQQKGAQFEEIIRELLKDCGFSTVRRQFGGSQFGFDLAAHRLSGTDHRAEVWKFECKNISNAITIDDLAPKLIWQFGRTTLDYYAIVSVTDPSNEFLQLLEHIDLPMPVLLWTGDTLRQLLLASPAACRRLGISSRADKPTLQLMRSSTTALRPPTSTRADLHGHESSVFRMEVPRKS